MDVGRPVGHCLADEEVDQLDDRRVFDDLFDRIEIVVVTEVRRRLGRDVVGLGIHAMVLVDGVEDRLTGGHDRLDLGPRDGADVVDGEDIARVAHGDNEHAVVPADRESLVATGQCVGDQRGRARVDRERVEIDELDADLRRQRAHQVGFGDEVLIEEHPSQGLARATLLIEREFELGLGQQATTDEEGPDPVDFRHRRARALFSSRGRGRWVQYLPSRALRVSGARETG